MTLPVTFPSTYVVTDALGWRGKRLVRLMARGFDCPALAAMPRLESLTFENGAVSPAAAAAVQAAKAWKKLDLGQ